MAPRKKAPPKKSATKTVAKKGQTTAHGAPASHTARPRGGASGAAPANGPQKAGAAGQSNIRVRMYRVGFGDFFLMTVPGKNGPAHILIDCGVHAKPLGDMNECVKNMAQTTNSKLALVILTHYHADHMSGFASN